MTQRTGHHRAGQVRHIAGICCQQHIQRQQPALCVKAHIIADQEGMTLAGGHHVIVTGQAQLHRSPRLVCPQRRNRRDDGGLRFLAPECPAHTAHIDCDLTERQAQNMGDTMLHLGRVLGGGKDLHLAGFTGNGNGDLAFQIEMILPATADFTFQAQRGGLKCSLRVAVSHHLIAGDGAARLQCLLNGQDGRALIPFHLD